jgi:polar amino acid transport system substrate-binding protein
MRRRFFLTAAAAVTGILMTTGAGQADVAQDLSSESVIEAIKKRGALKVGLSTFTPWAIRDKNGELIGFEIDVASRLAEDMGVEIDFTPTLWDGIIPALIAGNFDLIISGMSITPQRNLTVNFTAPYANSGMGIVANKEIAPNFAFPDDFDKRSVVISVRRGSTAVANVRQFMPKATIRQFDDEATAKQEVLNGNAHAWVTSAPKPAFAVFDNPDVLYLPIEDPFFQSAEAFALRKGDPDSLNFLNNWIDLRTRDGWLKSRHEFWFKTRDWADQVASN